MTTQAIEPERAPLDLGRSPTATRLGGPGDGGSGHRDPSQSPDWLGTRRPDSGSTVLELARSSAWPEAVQLHPGVLLPICPPGDAEARAIYWRGMVTEYWDAAQLATVERALREVPQR